jgi:hypothetical protein
MRPAATALLLLAICGLSACAGGGTSDGGGGGGGGGGNSCKNPPTPTVSLASNIQPILNQSCAVVAACHLGSGSGFGDFSAGNSFANLVKVKAIENPKLFRVDPGKPDNSYMVIKIGAGPAGSTFSGEQMPPGCPGAGRNGAVCLSADDVEAIRTWITECAPNN